MPIECDLHLMNSIFLGITKSNHDELLGRKPKKTC